MSDTALARIRAAVAVVRTPAELDRLLDDLDEVTGEHPALAEAAADVAESVFAARHALEHVAKERRQRE